MGAAYRRSRVNTCPMVLQLLLLQHHLGHRQGVLDILCVWKLLLVSDPTDSPDNIQYPSWLWHFWHYRVPDTADTPSAPVALTPLIIEDTWHVCRINSRDTCAVLITPDILMHQKKKSFSFSKCHTSGIPDTCATSVTHLLHTCHFRHTSYPWRVTNS